MSAALPWRPPASDAPSGALKQRAKRLATVGSIVFLHLGLFYALNHGMAQRVAKLPAVVFATLIQPEASHPAPPPLKTVALPKLAAPTVPALTQVALPEFAASSASPAAASTKASQATSTAAAPSVAITPTQAQPKTISSVEYLQPPQPEYPSMSRRMGEQGKVMLRILVNESGRAERIDVQRSSGFPRLDEAARIAAARALFKPYVEDGKATPVYVVVPIDFSLA